MESKRNTTSAGSIWVNLMRILANKQNLLIRPGGLSHDFFIMGFHQGQDEMVYKQKIDLCVSQLMLIMHWAESTDCIGADFPVSPDQAAEIASLASIELPDNLDLYLTDYAS